MGRQAKRDSNFMEQGAILAVASIVVRIIGLVYRIPLNNILGEKGVAYYGVAFDVYSILLLLSSYSLPLAVSKMVARRVTLGQFRNTKRIFACAMVFAAACGFAAFCITFFGAGFFAKILNYPQAAVALRMLSPALVILAVMGVLRGYFQGLQSMVPTAVSQVLEQIVNAVVSIVAAKAMFDSATDYSAAQYGFANVQEAYGAAGGTLGTVCGAAVGMVFLIFLFFRQGKYRRRKYRADKSGYEEAYGSILKVIVWTIVPVILSTTIYNISGLVDSGIFSNVMEAKGLDHDLIDTYTGMFTGNYRLIVNVPIALASALASSLIPSLVKSRTERDRQGVNKKVRFAIKLSMLIAIPSAVGIGVLSKPFINVLFPTSVDPDKVSLMLITGCVSVVLYTLSTITNSILQGIDRMSLPVVHSAIALGVHVVFLLGLLYLTDMNIFAVVIADCIFSLTVCILNARSLKKHLHYRQNNMRTFVLPAICAVLMGLITFVASILMDLAVHSPVATLLVSFIIAVISYFILAVKLGAVTAKELRAFPGGTILLRIAKKCRLM